jgi:hypothetical protein
LEELPALRSVLSNAGIYIPKPNFRCKGENLMDLSVVADWFTIIFFLWFGLKRFVRALDSDLFQTLGAVVALCAAIFTALST